MSPGRWEHPDPAGPSSHPMSKPKIQDGEKEKEKEKEEKEEEKERRKEGEKEKGKRRRRREGVGGEGRRRKEPDRWTRGSVPFLCCVFLR